MGKPIAYEPVQEAKYQILFRNQYSGRAWEHLDYATDDADKKHLLAEYRLAYGSTPTAFKVIKLPKKYWPAKG